MNDSSAVNIHHPYQSCEALGKVFFPVWLQGDKGIDGFGPQDHEKRFKINGSLTYRKVFILAAAIIMHMDFS